MNQTTPSPLEGNAQRSGASFFDVLASAVAVPSRTPQLAVAGALRFAWNADSENASDENQENGKADASVGARGNDRSASAGVVAGNAKSSTQATLPLPLHMRSNSAVAARVAAKQAQPQLSATVLAAKIAASVALTPAVAAGVISSQAAPSDQQVAAQHVSGGPANEAAGQAQTAASAQSVAHVFVAAESSTVVPITSKASAAVIVPPALQPMVSPQSAIAAAPASADSQRAESSAASAVAQLQANAAQVPAAATQLSTGAPARVSASPTEPAVARIDAQPSFIPANANAAPQQAAQGAKPMVQQPLAAASSSVTSQTVAAIPPAAMPLSSAALADITSLLTESATTETALPVSSGEQESSAAASIPEAAMMMADPPAQVQTLVQAQVFPQVVQPGAAKGLEGVTSAATGSGVQTSAREIRNPLDSAPASTFATRIGAGTRTEIKSANSTDNRTDAGTVAKPEAANSRASRNSAQGSDDAASQKQGVGAANSSAASRTDLSTGFGAAGSMPSAAVLAAIGFAPGAVNAAGSMDNTSSANKLTADPVVSLQGAPSFAGQLKNPTAQTVNASEGAGKSTDGTSNGSDTGANTGTGNSGNGPTQQHAQTDVVQAAPAANRVADASTAQMQQIMPQGSAYDAGTARNAGDAAQSLRQDRASQNDQQLQAQAADSQPASGINTARVMQSISGSEMHMGMRSAEFGDISIRTTVSQQLMTAQISVDHGDLGKAISAHLPAMQEKLGGELGIRASVEVSQSGMSFSGERGYSAERDQRPNAPHTGFETAEVPQEAEFAGYRTGAAPAGEGSRLDIRA